MLYIRISLFLLLSTTVISSVRSQNPIVQSIIDDVRIDSLTKFISQLTGESQVVINGQPDTIRSRHSFDPGNEKAFQFMKEKFTAFGLQVDSLTFSLTGKNLIGIKSGSVYPDSRFIIGAHYDNVGSPVAPGADDNASGTAGVLEAARIFSNYSFPFTIVFALWDEEEQGLLGSKAYAAVAASNNEQIKGYINMDMLGWDGNNDSTADLHFRHVASSLELASKAINVNSTYNIHLNLHLVDPGSGNTDQQAFWSEGFTAIGISEGYDHDFNPFWHTLADSLGQFNLPFYEKCVKLALATLGECSLDSNSTLGVPDPSLVETFSVYPNPASSQVNIILPLNSPAPIVLELTDISGRVVHTAIISNRTNIFIPIASFDSGLYVLRIRGNEFHRVKKIIINN